MPLMNSSYLVLFEPNYITTMILSLRRPALPGRFSNSYHHIQSSQLYQPFIYSSVVIVRLLRGLIHSYDALSTRVKLLWSLGRLSSMFFYLTQLFPFFQTSNFKPSHPSLSICTAYTFDSPSKFALKMIHFPSGEK